MATNMRKINFYYTRELSFTKVLQYDENIINIYCACCVPLIKSSNQFWYEMKRT